MADDVDAASKRMELESELTTRAARYAVAKMPKGEAGECDGCGEYFERTVNGYCGRCRDRLGLP